MYSFFKSNAYSFRDFRLAPKVNKDCTISQNKFVHQLGMNCNNNLKEVYASKLAIIQDNLKHVVLKDVK